MKTTLLNLTSLVCFVCTLATTPTLAQSMDALGAGSSNGGGVAKSSDMTKFLDLVKEATEVPYDMTSTKAYNTMLQAMERNSGYNAVSVFQQNMGATKTIKTRLIEALNRLQFVMTVRPLPPLNDAGLVILNWNFKGQIKRLAIQSVEHKIVLVDKSLFKDLLREDPNDEQHVAAFALHEAFIRVFIEGARSNLKSTERIGNIVNVTFGKDSLVPKLSARALAFMLNEAEIPANEQKLVGFVPMRWNSADIVYNKVDLSRFYIFFHRTGNLLELSATSKFRNYWSSSWANQNVMDFAVVGHPTAKGTFWVHQKSNLVTEQGYHNSILIENLDGDTIKESYPWGDTTSKSVFTMWRK